MLQWYWVVLMSIGFTLWTLFCILIGAGLVTNVNKNKDKSRPWPDREN